MSILNFIRAHSLILQFRLSGKSKQAAELSFWLHEKENYTKWYRGQITSHYGVLSPKPEEKRTGHSLEENAILTWSSVHRDKYQRHLMVPHNYFAGKKLLDVGCGPIPYALGFVDCIIYGLDPLVKAYKEIGYPLDSYSDRIKYVEGHAENIPFEDDFFDAIISVNALDHVDDFPKVANEICRVLNPHGVLLIEIHYHESRKTEPWFLTDKIISKYFNKIGVKKIRERSLTDIYPSYSDKEEKVVIWSNK